jgi:hypothetical protein
VQHFGEIGADEIRILRRLAGVFAALHLGRLDKQDRSVFEHHITDLEGDLPHKAGQRGVDEVLHLQSFHQRHRLALADGLTDTDFETHNRALHRGGHWLSPVGTRSKRRRRIGRR